MNVAGAPRLAPGLAASGAVGLGLVAGLAALLPIDEAAEAAAVSLARYLDNDFCFAILVLGVWIVAYGLLQVYGAGLERGALQEEETGAPVMRRLTAALSARALIGGEGLGDPSLRASVAADRFDANRSLRLAPINFAMAVPMFGVLTAATILLFTVLRTDLSLSDGEAYLLLLAYVVFFAWIVAEASGTITGVLPA